VKPAATALVAGMLFVWGVLTAAWAPPPSVAPVLMRRAPGVVAPPPDVVAPPPVAAATRAVSRPVNRVPLRTFVPAAPAAAPVSQPGAGRGHDTRPGRDARPAHDRGHGGPGRGHRVKRTVRGR
jgi:hypothetical protein